MKPSMLQQTSLESGSNITGATIGYNVAVANNNLHYYNYILYYRKIHCLTSEFHVKFHAKNHFAIRVILVFQVKFNVEFTCQAVNFS